MRTRFRPSARLQKNMRADTRSFAAAHELPHARATLRVSRQSDDWIMSSSVVSLTLPITM